ncbi:MAG: hypothetical protein L6R37_008289, partial [Teloschistes peruensis]
MAVIGTLSRVLIVSRDEPDIRSHLSPTGAQADSFTLYEHQIVVADVESDVLAFSKSIVDTKLANKSRATKDQIAEKMAAKCDGMFLWIDLHKRNLRGGKNKRQLQQSIEETPAGLESIYERNWNDILKLASNDKSRAMKILRWAIFAARPLTVAEITEALLVLDNDDCRNLQLDDLPDCIDNEYIADEISGLCGSLLEVRSTGSDSSPGLMTIHLKHFSVKQFLLTTNGQSELSDTQIYTSSYSEIQNNHLAITCLRYLRDENVQEDLRAQSGNRPFVDYAVQSWHRHVSTAGKRFGELNRIATEFFMPDNSEWNLWRLRFHQLWNLDHPEDEREGQNLPSPIYYAAYFGLEETVNHLQSKEPDSINVIGGLHGTPIKAAYAAGHLKLVVRLVGLRADLNISEGRHGSILGSASHGGDVQTCKYLLANGAKVLLADENERSPLFLASENGHLDAAKLLLEHKSDLTIANRNGWTPVNAASDNGHVEVVKLLLEHHADLSIASNDGSTPIHVASENGHMEVVKVLLEQNADLSVPDEDRRTPIHAASCNGHMEVVKLLLEQNADLSIPDKDGWTPIHAASVNGHVEVVKLLLEHGADLSVANINGWTPIHSASCNGHMDVVKVLLGQNADLLIPNKNGWTPIHVASCNGHVEVVKVLLEHHADLSIPDNNGWTLIYAASYNGHVE